MTDIKPIETRYKGYRFRSRLEARWAVFFDTLGIRWDYEPEGFELPSGRYLPDFWLPDADCWVEIKPEQTSKKQRTWRGVELSVFWQLWELCWATQKRAVLFAGSIGIPDFLRDGPPGEDFIGSWGRGINVFVDDEKPKGPDDPKTWDLPFTFWQVCGRCLWASPIDLECPIHGPRGKGARNDHREVLRLRDAYAAARGARFEHGESG